MPPIKIEIIALLPEELGLCDTCTAFLDQVSLVKTSRDRSLDSYPPEYQREVDRLAELIKDISSEFGERVLIRLVDPRSIEGLATLIRHGIRSYPTLLVNGKEKITNLEWKLIKQAIQNAQKPKEFM